MIWVVAAFVVIWAIGWFVAQLVAAVLQATTELGNAASGSASSLSQLIGRALARGTPNIVVSAKILDTNVPGPQSDSVKRRLDEFSKAEFSWPTWNHYWRTQFEWDSASISIEEIENLPATRTECQPPYELTNEAEEFPPAPSFPKEPTFVNEDYPIPTLTMPVSKVPLRLFDKVVVSAYLDAQKQHDTHLKKQRDLIESANALNSARRAAFHGAVSAHNRQVERYKQARIAFTNQRASFLVPMLTVTNLVAEGKTREAALVHFDLVLRSLTLPRWVPREWSLEYDADSRTLLVEHRFPPVADAQIVTTATTQRRATVRPASKRARRDAVARIQSALPLVIGRSIADSDTFDLIDGIGVNGWVRFFDKSTGHLSKAYCCNFVCSKGSLLDLSMRTLDPVAAFARLRGVIAQELYEAAPTRPNLKMSTKDNRFVAPRETLATMTEAQNLAAMPWEDFEHLVRELFQRKFGNLNAEVKITRASRDHGVDAIIFDSDPIRGGKIVVQAKRYTMPVDVSSVRDLYGTVMNEGASSGVLVTTSTFGPDSYAFAQNKPLKLLNGSELLGLLEEVGFKFRIDLVEARRLLGIGNT